MPVLYVAVGRRLGYPLKLAETRAHLFFRWEDLEGKHFGFPEQFNVEGAGEGIAMRSDEHYLTWPESWSDADKRGGWYLRSLTLAQELAGFLVARGECLADNGRLSEAIQSYQWACVLAPEDERYAWHLRRYSSRMAADQFRALEYADEQRRRQRDRHLNGSATPGHSPSCECGQCRTARETDARHGALGHMPKCQCALCREARVSAKFPGFSGHAADCGCFDCREARRVAQSNSSLGHLPGCECDRCKELRASKSSPGRVEHGPSCQCLYCTRDRASAKPIGVPGHPRSCQCFHCQQARRTTMNRAFVY